MAKVLDSRINFAQEQMITLGVSVQALDLDAELRPEA
jgi:hypothetical protein